MMKKLLSVFLVLVLSFSMVLMPSVKAQPFGIVDIDVDGRDVDNLDYLYVDRGDTINIVVEVAAMIDLEDLTFWDVAGKRVEGISVEAEILGYRYDDIDDRSERFYLEAYTGDVNPLNDEFGTDFATLRLSIPEDMDLSDSRYTLRITASNQQYRAEEEIPLKVRAQETNLNIMDVIFTPGLTLDAGQPLFTTVRLENMGYEKAEDVRVSVSVPQLGREGVTYVDELAPADRNEDDNEDLERSESSDAIYLDTRGAQPGTYNLIVKAEFDRGHEEVTETYQLVINGAPAQVQNVLVDSAETIKNTAAGQGVVYKIDIANMGSLARSFTAEVSGLDFGNYRVDPTLTVVQAGSSAEMFVYVSPNQDAVGQRAFTVNVKEGNEIVKQINFQMNIEEGKSEWGNVLTGLEIGFVVLLIILVILGIILAATRMGKKNGEEPLGETYY